MASTPYRENQSPKELCEACNHELHDPSPFHKYRRKFRHLLFLMFFTIIVLPATMGVSVEGCYGSFHHHNTVSAVATIVFILFIVVIAGLATIIIE